MNKEQFKKRWESNKNGGGITVDDIAACAKSWGVCSSPKTKPIQEVIYKVLVAAETLDAEDYKPEKED